MIRHLRLENLVLIREADLELSDGLVAITGETGAGKTIFAQALGLLLGAPGDQSLVGPDASEAYVEADLDLADELLHADELEPIRELQPAAESGVVIARRIFADGRSRSYVWGRAVPRAALGAFAERLIALSGQFEQRRLASSAHQLSLLDAFVGEAHLDRLAATAVAWRELRDAQRQRDAVAAASDELEARRAELEQLATATDALMPDTERSLAAERERLRRASDLAAAAGEAVELLSPEGIEQHRAAELIAQAAKRLGEVEGIDPTLDTTRSELSSSEAIVREAASALRSFLASLHGDPMRLDAVESQLQDIADLKRRFGCSDLDELLEGADSARAELDQLSTSQPLASAERALRQARSRYTELAEALAAARAEAAPRFTAAALEELKALGLGEGDLTVELGQRGAGPGGAETVAFYVRPNDGLPYVPVASNASGGELSRIALALRVVAHVRAGEPTIVFDEIDAGVGGTTAHAVARSLERLAQRAQVLAITHLPQVASVGQTHLRVEKVAGHPTHTRIDRLEQGDRAAEIERMLGGTAFLESVVSERRSRPARV